VLIREEEADPINQSISQSINRSESKESMREGAREEVGKKRESERRNTALSFSLARSLTPRFFSHSLRLSSLLFAPSLSLSSLSHSLVHPIPLSSPSLPPPPLASLPLHLLRVLILFHVLHCRTSSTHSCAHVLCILQKERSSSLKANLLLLLPPTLLPPKIPSSFQPAASIPLILPCQTQHYHPYKLNVPSRRIRLPAQSPDATRPHPLLWPADPRPPQTLPPDTKSPRWTRAQLVPDLDLPCTLGPLLGVYPHLLLGHLFLPVLEKR